MCAKAVPPTCELCPPPPPHTCNWPRAMVKSYPSCTIVEFCFPPLACCFWQVLRVAKVCHNVVPSFQDVRYGTVRYPLFGDAKDSVPRNRQPPPLLLLCVGDPVLSHRSYSRPAALYHRGFSVDFVLVCSMLPPPPPSARARLSSPAHRGRKWNRIDGLIDVCVTDTTTPRSGSPTWRTASSTACRSPSPSSGCSLHRIPPPLLSR